MVSESKEPTLKPVGLLVHFNVCRATIIIKIAQEKYGVLSKTKVNFAIERLLALQSEGRHMYRRSFPSTTVCAAGRPLWKHLFPSPQPRLEVQTLQYPITPCDYPSCSGRLGRGRLCQGAAGPDPPPPPPSCRVCEAPCRYLEGCFTEDRFVILRVKCLNCVIPSKHEEQSSCHVWINNVSVKVLAVCCVIQQKHIASRWYGSHPDLTWAFSSSQNHSAAAQGKFHWGRDSICSNLIDSRLMSSVLQEQQHDLYFLWRKKVVRSFPGVKKAHIWASVIWDI